jgi:hypothetical protein
MGYLNKYGSRARKFQGGGEMAPAGPPPEAPAGPGAGGGEEEIIGLAQAAAQGDMEAAAQLGMMLAPMILEQAGAAGAGPEGAPAGPEGGEMAPPPEGGAPVFRRGGKFIGKKY